MRFVLAIVLAACGAMLGCAAGDTIAPRSGLTVLVDPASIVGLRSPVNPPGGFGGQARLRNTTRFDIRVDACTPDVEREVRPGEWQVVLRRFCTAQLDLSDIEVPAMGEVSLGWAAYAPLSASGPVAVDADLSGRYRLVYRYRLDGWVDDLEEARSAPFVVTD
jgi:hypothetical protein